MWKPLQLQLQLATAAAVHDSLTSTGLTCYLIAHPIKSMIYRHSSDFENSTVRPMYLLEDSTIDIPILGPVLRYNKLLLSLSTVRHFSSFFRHFSIGLLLRPLGICILQPSTIHRSINCMEYRRVRYLTVQYVRTVRVRACLEVPRARTRRSIKS